MFLLFFSFIGSILLVSKFCFERNVMFLTVLRIVWFFVHFHDFHVCKQQLHCVHYFYYNLNKCCDFFKEKIIVELLKNALF